MRSATSQQISAPPEKAARRFSYLRSAKVVSFTTSAPVHMQFVLKEVYKECISKSESQIAGVSLFPRLLSVGVAPRYVLVIVEGDLHRLADRQGDFIA